MGLQCMDSLDYWKSVTNYYAIRVIFRNGTCVLIPIESSQPDIQAKELLGNFGLVEVGASGGDFGVFNIQNAVGWIVTSQHPSIITYVSPNDVDVDYPIKFGLLRKIYYFFKIGPKKYVENQIQIGIYA